MLLLTFIAGANRYAIDVARVVELVPKVELRSIPHAPPYLAGLLGYRGKVVPVIDLGLLMGTAPCRDCLSTRIILVNDAPGDHNHGKDDPDDSSENRRRSPANPMPDSSLLGLIGEQVSERDHLRHRVLRERSGDMGAAVSTAEQPHAHSRVCLIAEGCFRIE